MLDGVEETGARVLKQIASEAFADRRPIGGIPAVQVAASHAVQRLADQPYLHAARRIADGAKLEVHAGHPPYCRRAAGVRVRIAARGRPIAADLRWRKVVEGGADVKR